MTETFAPQDAKYWAGRSLEDMRKDWGDKSYQESLYHPHRQVLMHVMKLLSPFKSVLEIGCNSGPNLIRISDLYPDSTIAGIDPSKAAIEQAMDSLPDATLVQGVAEDLGVFKSKFFDVVIADAVYMYVKDIDKALDEADRVCRNAIVIFDWYSEKETIKDFHYARNYTKLLEKRGFDVSVVDITENIWPSKKWQQNGKLFIAARLSPISEIN